MGYKNLTILSKVFLFNIVYILLYSLWTGKKIVYLYFDEYSCKTWLPDYIEFPPPPDKLEQFKKENQVKFYMKTIDKKDNIYFYIKGVEFKFDLKEMEKKS